MNCKMDKPIGFAVHNEDRYSDNWSYNITVERLIAYNHDKIFEAQSSLR